MLRGFIALLVALQLISGMGVARFISSALNTDSRYDASTVIAQSDTFSDDLSAADPLGNDGSSDDDPFYGASVIIAKDDRQSIPTEGQVAFGLRGSTTNRAIHPTGPPSLS